MQCDVSRRCNRHQLVCSVSGCVIVWTAARFIPFDVSCMSRHRIPFKTRNKDTSWKTASRYFFSIGSKKVSIINERQVRYTRAFRHTEQKATTDTRAVCRQRQASAVSSKRKYTLDSTRVQMQPHKNNSSQHAPTVSNKTRSTMANTYHYRVTKCDAVM